MYASLCDLLELSLNPFMPSPYVAGIGIDPRILDTAGDQDKIGEIRESMKILSMKLIHAREDTQCESQAP